MYSPELWRRRVFASTALVGLRQFKFRNIPIAATVFAALALASTVHYATVSAVELDDAYIYFRSIENFLRTGDLSFNTGDARNLMTSAGWFLVLTGSKVVFPNAELTLIAKAWSTFLLLASSVLLFRILSGRMPDVAPFSPLPVFFMPSIPGLVGHDTGLALFTNLLLIWAFLERRSILFPVAAAVAYLARGEAAIFAVVLGLAYVCSDGSTNRKILAKTRELAIGLAIALAIVSLWHGFHFMTTGAMFPQTFSAKTLQADSGRWPLFAIKIGAHLRYVTGQLGLWVHVLSILGLWLTWRRVWPLATWPLVHYVTLVALGLPWYHWYYYPVEFAIIIGFVASGALISRLLGQRLHVISGPIRQFALTLSVCTIAVAPLRTGLANIPGRIFETGPATAAVSDATRFSIYREFAGWIVANHTKPTAPVILTHEVGIIGYFVPEARVLDVVGLASPAESAADMYNYEKCVRLYVPDFILRFHFVKPPAEILYQVSPDRTLRYVAGITKYLGPKNLALSIYRLDDSRDAGGPN